MVSILGWKNPFKKLNKLNLITGFEIKMGSASTKTECIEK